jgi:hypothetical protein
VNYLIASVLLVAAAALVWFAIPAVSVSNKHLKKGVENAGPRKWLSLLMIVSGLFCLTGAILLISS